MKAPEETVELTQFRRMLCMSGLWFPKRKSWIRYLQCSRLFVYLLTVILWDWSLSRVPLHQVSRKSYTPIVIWSNAHFLTTVFIAWRSSSLRSFADGMSGLFRKRTGDHAALFARLTANIWKYIAASFGHVLLISLIVSLLPTLIDVFFILFSDSTVPFYIPITLESFLPDARSRSFLFYVLNISNGLLVIIPTVYYVALLTALPATVTYIYLELEVFKLKLQAWSSSDKADPDRKNALGEVIRDHAELLRLVKIIREILGTAFSTQNFVTSINTGFLLNAAKKAMSEGDVMLITQQLYFFTQLVGVTLLCCYIGEILHSKGWEVSESLYNLPWYEESPRIRQDLCMVLIATQQPIVFDYKNQVPLNLETFAELMNRAYTIFILLESVQ